MTLRAKLLQWGLSILATAWSLALMVAGLALILDLTPQWPIFQLPLLSLGICLVAAGNTVFLAAVADRWFPNASPRLVENLEMTSCLIFFTALAVCVLWFISL